MQITRRRSLFLLIADGCFLSSIGVFLRSPLYGTNRYMADFRAGDASYHDGQYPKAARRWQDAVNIAPRLGSPYSQDFWLETYLADAYRRSGQFPQAVTYYEAALVQPQPHSGYWTNARMGLNLARKRRQD